MWQIKNIKFENLFSHASSEYVFKNNTCTLIVGENRDNGGNNGAGKSTLFEAITIALTNKSLRDLKKENFINRDAEDCFISLELENKILKSTLSINRRFFRGNKSAKVEIIENGEIDTTIVSVDEANKRIFELIGISRDDLLRYFIISQDNRYTFFTAGDVEKKEVLNRITSADMINPLLEKLSADKKLIEQQRAEINNKIISIQAKKETLEEQLEELLNEDNSEEIEQLSNKINRLHGNLENIDIERKRLSELIKKNQTELNSIEDINVDSLIAERKKKREKIKEIEEQIDDNNRVARAAKSDLEGSTTCPECGVKFIKDSQLNLSVDELEDLLQSVDKNNKESSKKRNKLSESIKELNDKIEEAESISEQKSELSQKIKRLNIKIGGLQDEEDDIKAKIKKYTSEVKKLKEQKENSAAIKSLKDKISDCDKEFNVTEQEGIKVDEELEMVNFWHHYMGKSGFMTYVANRAVSVLEGTVNSFLKKFKSSLSVNINGFKILRDGSVREKIEVFALENGLNAETFMSKSGGERGRINLAGVLSIQHLINLSTNGKGLNLLMLDETFGGIDSEGQEGIIRILENLGITVIMITQNVSSEFNNDNKLIVVKENGVSRFE